MLARDVELVGAHVIGHLERPQDLRGDVAGVLDPVVAFEDDRELVTAETGNAVAFPDRIDQALGHLLEQPVADGVTEAVVDGLELVEVEEHQRDQAAVAPGAGDGVL